MTAYCRRSMQSTDELLDEHEFLTNTWIAAAGVAPGGAVKLRSCRRITYEFGTTAAAHTTLLAW